MQIKEKEEKNFKKLELSDIISNTIVVVFALFSLFPLYWLFTSSFKNNVDVLKMPPDWFPKNPTIDNYTELFNNQPAFRWAFNSLFVAFATTVIVVCISALAAYAFSKLEFVGKNVIFVIFIASLMIPKEVMIVPLFKIIQRFDWMNTYSAMIWPNVASAFGVFMLKNFFDTIPDSLRESAKLDGATEFKTFTSIVLPIVKPGLGALFILNFVNVWNDYLWQLVVAPEKNMKTLMVGIASLMQDFNPNMAYKMAGAAVASIPMLIVFILFQKYFTRGIAIGAVKE